MEMFSDGNEFLKFYQRVRKFQFRQRFRFQKKTKSALVIQDGCEDWFWKPICNDGEHGIEVLVGLQECGLHECGLQECGIKV